MSRSHHAVVIGSGHNGLVVAAYLARAGWEVEVLERNSDPGGAVAATFPGPGLNAASGRIVERGLLGRRRWTPRARRSR